MSVPLSGQAEIGIRISNLNFARRAGIVDAVAEPAPVMLLALLSFGVIAKESGLGLFETIFSTAALWALPAQIVHAEAEMSGRDFFSIAMVVAIINLRFLPMVSSLFAEMKLKSKIELRDVFYAHLITPASWTWCMSKFAMLPWKYRQIYFFYFAFTVWLFGIAGSFFGYVVADHLSGPARLIFIVIAPMYMLLLLVRVGGHRLLAVVVGGGVGYFCAELAGEWSLFIAAIVGGVSSYAVWTTGRLYQ